jgi:glycerophosphoryl diester phosphodiesterase
VTSPLVIAHRGSSAGLPEHTRSAYVNALDEGVDGFECDVRLTRDGHLVCVHDAVVDRTSDGRGRVSAMTLAELDALDFSGGRDGPGVLTLESLITLALSAGRPLRLLIETKHPSRFGGAVEERVVALLRRYGLTSANSAAETGLSVAVMSFSPLAVRRVQVLAPAVPAVFPFGATVLGPGIKALRARPEVVRRAHARGHQVYVWTVNEPDDIDLVLELEVDAVISDRPADVIARLKRD